jgi:hypothetical protein
MRMSSIQYHFIRGCSRLWVSRYGEYLRIAYCHDVLSGTYQIEFNTKPKPTYQTCLPRFSSLFSHSFRPPQSQRTEAVAQRNDDQNYLSDMTAKCILKKKLWDQRVQMRTDELSALTNAVQTLRGERGFRKQYTPCRR